jgi:hypothetical protein
MATSRIQFSTAQVEAILDRLSGATDCIVEILTADHPKWKGKRGLVEHTAQTLIEKLDTSGRLPVELCDLECEILQDAIEGSTYLAQLWGSTDRADLLAYNRRLRSMTIAVEKLRQCGVTIRSVPTC